MTITVLFEVDAPSVQAVVEALQLAVERDSLGWPFKIEGWSTFPGKTWEIADNLLGPHPLPKVGDRFVVDLLGTDKPFNKREPDILCTVKLDDGSVVTLPWGEIEDEDEVLSYWDERFDELD